MQEMNKVTRRESHIKICALGLTSLKAQDLWHRTAAFQSKTNNSHYRTYSWICKCQRKWRWSRL